METKPQNKNKVAEESLKKVMTEGNEPSVENLMLALNQAKARINQMQMQMAQMAEAYKEMQLKLAFEEYKVRFEYLFKILESEDYHCMFGDEFTEKCITEVKDMLFPEPPAEQKEDKE